MRTTIKPFPGGYSAVVTTKDGHPIAVAVHARRNRNTCAHDGLALLAVLRK